VKKWLVFLCSIRNSGKFHFNLDKILIECRGEIVASLVASCCLRCEVSSPAWYWRHFCRRLSVFCGESVRATSSSSTRRSRSVCSTHETMWVPTPNLVSLAVLIMWSCQWSDINHSTHTVAIWYRTAIKHPVPDRVKSSFVIFWHLEALWRSALSSVAKKMELV